MSWWNDILNAPNDPMAYAPTQQFTSGGGSGFNWGDIIDVAAPIIGGAAQGYFANQGVNAATNAQTAANQQAIQLQRDIYNDQQRRSQPWQTSGGNALNLINAWNGLPQVPLNAPGSSLGGTSGNGLLPNLGAGQPVPGHSGGGGANRLASGAGAAIGTYFGGPIGGLVGSLAGGLIRNGGDNWTTLATQAPPGFDYATYMANSPDLQAEWAKPDVQALFGGNQDAYANWHYNQFGKNEGRVLSPVMNEQTTQPVGGSPQEANANGSGVPDVWGAIKNNPLYQSAQDAFLAVDTPDVRAAYATGGQALSGAQLKALHDRGTARSGNALSQIYGNIANEAGLGYTAASGTNQNAGQMGANVGNLLQQNGQIAGQGAAQKNANWMNAAGNALGSLYGTAQNKGWLN